jgi:predicted transglutaminase-like cysteine proteinase
MSPSKLIGITALAAALAGSGAAFAQGTPSTPQTHHCKMPDGSMDMKKTHKQCTAAKGTWAQDAPKAAPKDAPKAAPKDAPKGGTAPAPTPPAAAPKQ